MAITSADVVGPIVLPSGEVPAQGKILFTLNGWDVENDTTIIPGPASVDLDDVGGFTASLWCTTEGGRTVSYRAKLSYWSAVRSRLVDVDLSSFVLEPGGPYELADLLAQPPVEMTGPDVLAVAQAAAERAETAADSISDSAALAQAWAESATPPGGVGTKSAKTWATEAASSALSIGAVIPVVTQAEARLMDTLAAGRVIWVSDIYGGSYWRAAETAQVVTGQSSTAYTFEDELTFFRTISGKPFMFDIELNADILRSREQSQYRDWFSKQTSRDTAQNIACYGDSLTFGQAAASASGATNRIGTATGYGDGSSHAQWQYDEHYPKQLGDALTQVRSASITVHNRGYSGDTAAASYTRHRTPPSAGVSLIWLSAINEVQSATSNGVDLSDINTDTTKSTAAYAEALQKFAAREILRGNSIIIFGPPNFNSLAGSWDGTSQGATRAAQAYMTAARSVADFLGVQFVDVRKEVLDQYTIGDIQSDGAHFNPVGLRVLGRRIAAMFIGQGWRHIARAQPGSVIVANPATANIASQALLPVEINLSSGGPGFVSANPTSVGVINGDPVTFSFFAEVPDMILYVNGSAVDATATIELDGAALQQDYQSALSAGYTVQPYGSGPVSTRTCAYTGTHFINRSSKRWTRSDALYFHVTGRGWHTLTVYLDSGTTLLVDGLEFQAWETERKPREELIIRTTDSTAIQSSTAFAADSVLQFPVAANEVVDVECWIGYNSGVTPAFKWYLLGPTFWTAVGLKDGNHPADQVNFGVTVSETGSANNRWMRFNARVTTGANAGTISFQWAQGTSTASDTKLLAGSRMVVRRP